MFIIHNGALKHFFPPVSCPYHLFCGQGFSVYVLQYDEQPLWGDSIAQGESRSCKPQCKQQICDTAAIAETWWDESLNCNACQQLETFPARICSFHRGSFLISYIFYICPTKGQMLLEQLFANTAELNKDVSKDYSNHTLMESTVMKIVRTLILGGQTFSYLKNWWRGLPRKLLQEQRR